jgi:hypothetical protein
MIDLLTAFANQPGGTRGMKGIMAKRRPDNCYFCGELCAAGALSVQDVVDAKKEDGVFRLIVSEKNLDHVVCDNCYEHFPLTEKERKLVRDRCRADDNRIILLRR